LTTDVNGNAYLRLPFAKVKTSEIFETIGVQIEWIKDLSHSSDSNTIKLSVLGKAPQDASARWLASALPYERTHIVVFYDRVASAAGIVNVDDMLAYVFVHEITHLLQGISRHSLSGIMKPSWDSADRREMNRGTLTFTPIDIELIRDSLMVSARTSAARND
jgi:hypothetical protein